MSLDIGLWEKERLGEESKSGSVSGMGSWGSKVKVLWWLLEGEELVDGQLG